MDRHAGFAAALNLSQDTLQDFLRIVYHAGTFPAKLTTTVDQAFLDQFLDAPTIEFRASDPAHLTMRLSGWGPVIVTLDGKPPEFRQAFMQLDFTAAPDISVSLSQLFFRLDAQSATIVTLTFTPFSGGPFSPEVAAYLASPGFIGEFQKQLRLVITAFGDVVPPLTLAFLGGIGEQVVLATPRVLDGVIAVGLDLRTDEVNTFGDPNLLIDFREGNHIAMWSNPDRQVAAVSYSAVRTKLKEAVTKQGATLDSYDFSIKEGFFQISGSGSKTGGSVNFSMKAVPKLVRPGEHVEYEEEDGEHIEYTTPDREELFFDMQDVHVDVDRDWWAAALEIIGGIITLGLGAFVAEAIIGMITGNVEHAIEANSNTSQAARNQEFTIDGAPDTPILMRLERYESHAEGVFVGVLIKPQFRAAKLDGPTVIPVRQAQATVARWRLTPPYLLLAKDPQHSVTWTFRRTDTNEILFTATGRLPDFRAFSRASVNTDFLASPQFRVDCSVFRTFGTTRVPLFDDHLFLKIADPLDRSHPFVKWQHDAQVPAVRIEPNGARTILGYSVRRRHSKIHRTALPGRCQFADRFSLDILIRQATDAPIPALEYLDDLPFPVADLPVHRREVCDYCFFGGPTKDVPLIT